MKISLLPIPLLITLIFFLPIAAGAEPADAQLLRESYFSDVTELERDYFVYLPANFSDEKLWPVIMFLHGDGERGNAKDELDFVKIHGLLYETWIQKRDLPFVIIAPQLPIHDRGDIPYIRDRMVDDIPPRLADGTTPRNGMFRSDDPIEREQDRMPDQFDVDGPPSGWPLHDQELIGMVDRVIEKYRGDPDRIYLSGLSYGGFGVWNIANRHPERFAAINPIVGYAHPDQVSEIARHQLPVWCFAGGKDPVVPAEYFYSGINKLEQLGHNDVRFTVEEDMSHDVWKRVYAGEDIYTWLLSKSK